KRTTFWPLKSPSDTVPPPSRGRRNAGALSPGPRAATSFAGMVPSFRLFRPVILGVPLNLGRGAFGCGILREILDLSWGCASTCSVVAADKAGDADPA